MPAAQPAPSPSRRWRILRASTSVGMGALARATASVYRASSPWTQIRMAKDDRPNTGHGPRMAGARRGHVLGVEAMRDGGKAAALGDHLEDPPYRGILGLVDLLFAGFAAVAVELAGGVCSRPAPRRLGSRGGRLGLFPFLSPPEAGRGPR